MQRLNRKSLAQVLDHVGIDKRFYALYGEGRWEALHLDEVDDRWVVSYWERGIRRVVVSFDSEADACQYMLDTLNKDPTVRVNYVTMEPDAVQRWLSDHGVRPKD